MSDDRLDNINMPALVSQFVPLSRMGNLYRAKCPFHDDHDPSFTVYSHSAFCFGCGRYFGPITFVAAFQNITYTEAMRWLGAQTGIELVQLPKRQREYNYPIPREIIEHWHSMVDRDYMYSRLLIDETINYYRLGNDGQHHIIPIWEWAPCVSDVYGVKRRRVDNDGIRYTSLKGRGKPRLFNKWLLINLVSFAIIFIGEFDAILGYQDRLPVISSTSGQNSWDPEWTSYMRHLEHIYVCPDFGESVAGFNIASQFLGRASVHTFPKETKDYTEYRQADYTVEDFCSDILGVDYDLVSISSFRI